MARLSTAKSVDRGAPMRAPTNQIAADVAACRATVRPSHGSLKHEAMAEVPTREEFVRGEEQRNAGGVA
eukprot:CAMPEP_0175895356 /NCGR_PEP_ID=MMETSP0107_2-20121207/50471_1 /TAXON_ID=195067 ORGANISM="Goniomonas pacifica, Strain CCMP1869" /NCGR_SAMPLE_ID=MMETSP0107_2 /ASSEMBLY_ACC=CAM_ASM_000203 /LENGTH=68 /DNA_ID=CAMNT_0017216489 /DNA_START=314 /DNA_END=518 /DNA_ORIENTATION=+